LPLGGALTLTPGQLRAIAWEDGSYLLSATAGSGKTRVLVERFVRSVVDRHVAPDRILAITFTDKAAHELRTRIRRRLAELGRRDAARAADATSISTIHAFCSRVLRQGALAAGLDPRFDVLDDAGAGRLRSRAFDLALAEFFDAFSDPAVDLAGSLGMRRLQEGVQVVHDVLRSRGTREPRLPVARSGRDVALARERLATTRAAAAAELGRIARPGRAVETALARLERCAELLDAGFPADLAAVAVGRGAAALTTPACEAYSGALDELVGALADAQAVVVVPLIDGLLDIYGRTFAQLKRAAGAVDFDDLELEALALLRDDDALRRAWAERFDLLMIDEFQDTNPRQAQLLGLLERDNLFMVGDVRQSIYGFRGAQPRIFEDRRETLGGAATGTLDESFRTRPRIAAAVNVAFAGRLGGAYVPLKAARDSVEDEPDVELLVTDTSGWTDAPGATTAWRRAEAETLARRVVELVASGAAQPAETVVLLRAATDMAAYERALAEGGLATLAVGGGYWRSLEVVDLVGYLRALANPLDTEALYELLGSPLVGLSPDALVLVGLAADRTGQDPWRALEHAELGPSGPGSTLSDAPPGISPSTT
jgi:ATP-dependent helicase/nuclease subunit A